MQPIIKRSHGKYGNAIFVRLDLNILSIKLSEELDIVILKIEIQNCTIASIYKPLFTPFVFYDPEHFNNNFKLLIIIRIQILFFQ